ncbi:MAG TPA: hypothetical protein VKY37_11530 [Brumimicrobium sp.]|nr:hypothetical protein [Brumimicrobium sp.]
MRIILFFYISLFFASHYGISQEYSWELKGTYNQKNIEAWDVNPLEEMIVASKGTLHKLDTNFQVMFTQSKKEYGDISKIDARHSLKTLLFSENQQMLAFVDNTLSYQDGKVDLANLGVDYATLVCYSDQSNRFWVYDEQNSRMIRFEGLKSIVKRSEISNLTSITMHNMPNSIIESQNQVFLFYKDGGIFVFDYYGSLLRKYDYSDVIKIFPNEAHIYLLKKNHILRVDRKNGLDQTIPLPLQEVEDFRVFGSTLYFKDKLGIKKYSLIPIE